MKKIRDTVGKVVNGISYISMAVCFAMVFVVAIDVILRKVSGQKLSISGSNEFSSYFLIVIVMLAIPVMQVKKGHVWVNMFVNMFPAKLNKIWMGVVLFIEAVVSAALCYAAVQQTITLLGNDRATDVLNMPWWPFAIVCAFGFFELTVLLVIDCIQYFIDSGKPEEKEAIAE
ncbi:MAG: TRAP transporter small permease [Oscillospiraceae bacterium]|nr:TRAP transporter small permease [Oscillospiraceae bacterium]